jgi:anti-anti-sigma factor
MNLSTDQINDVAVVRVKEPRMMYPALAEFSGAVMALISSGQRKVLVDLAPVAYVDSATIGCFMDLYRQVSAVGGTLKLSGVQPRVGSMLSMTGAQKFIELHAAEADALQSFEVGHAHD